MDGRKLTHPNDRKIAMKLVEHINMVYFILTELSYSEMNGIIKKIKKSIQDAELPSIYGQLKLTSADYHDSKKIIENIIFEVLPCIKSQRDVIKELLKKRKEVQERTYGEAVSLVSLFDNLDSLERDCASFLENNPKSRAKIEARKDVNDLFKFCRFLYKVLNSLRQQPKQFSADQIKAMENIQSAMEKFKKKVMEYIKSNAMEKEIAKAGLSFASEIALPTFSDIESYHNIMEMFMLNVLPLINKFKAEPDTELAKKADKNADEKNDTDLSKRHSSYANGVLIKIDNLCDSYCKKYPELKRWIEDEIREKEFEEKDIDQLEEEVNKAIEREKQAKKEAKQKEKENAKKKAKEEQEKKAQEKAKKEASLTPEEKQARVETLKKLEKEALERVKQVTEKKLELAKVKKEERARSSQFWVGSHVTNQTSTHVRTQNKTNAQPQSHHNSGSRSKRQR